MDQNVLKAINDTLTTRNDTLCIVRGLKFLGIISENDFLPKLKPLQYLGKLLLTGRSIADSLQTERYAKQIPLNVFNAFKEAVEICDAKLPPGVSTKTAENFYKFLSGKSFDAEALLKFLCLVEHKLMPPTVKHFLN